MNNETTHSSRSGLVKKGLLPFIIVGVIVLAIIFLTLRTPGNNNNNPSNVIAGEQDRIKIAEPKAEQNIDKQFQFPLKDSTGKEVSKIRYFVDDVEVRDELVIKGKKAVAIEGRTFLVVTLKVTNDYSRPISINVRDYIRLIVNGSQEKLAPDIHNDPVEIQPISTKYTRVAFPIDDKYKNLMLQVGEINGKKQNVNLDLK